MSVTVPGAAAAGGWTRGRSATDLRDRCPARSAPARVIVEHDVEARLAKRWVTDELGKAVLDRLPIDHLFEPDLRS